MVVPRLASALSTLLAALLAALLTAGSLLAAPVQAAVEAPDPGALTRPPLAGLRVAIDPGHNGGNATHPERLARLVPNGRGGSKACNTTGTATPASYPEHAAVWAVLNSSANSVFKHLNFTHSRIHK